MSSSREIPAWPKYAQLFVVSGLHTFVKLVLLAIVWFLGRKWLGQPAALGLCAVIFVSPTLPIMIINGFIRGRWAGKLNGSLTWPEAVSVAERETGSWILLYNENQHGQMSFGTYSVIGGQDDIVLYSMQTGEAYVVAETELFRTRQVAHQANIPIQPGGELNAEVAAKLLLQASNKPGDEVNADLARIHPSLVPEVVEDLTDLLRDCFENRGTRHSHPSHKLGVVEACEEYKRERSIIHILAQLGSRAISAEPLLVEMTKEYGASHVVFTAALEALASMRSASDGATEAFMKEFAAADSEYALQQSIAKVEQVGYTAGMLEPLKEAIFSYDARRAKAAAQILGRMGPGAKDALPLLERALNDGHPVLLDKEMQKLLRDAHQSISAGQAHSPLPPLDPSRFEPAPKPKPSGCGWIVAVSFIAMFVMAFLRGRDIALFLPIMFLLIVLHETGHWFAALLVGIPIRRFVIGLGPCLFSFQAARTRLEFRAIPLAGFVEPYFTEIAAPKRPPTDPLPRFGSATENVSVWRRFVFSAAGLAANFVAASLLFWAYGLATVDLVRSDPERTAPAHEPTLADGVRVAAITCVMFAGEFDAIIGDTFREIGREHDDERAGKIRRDIEAAPEGTILSLVAMMSCFLVVLNLLPVPPLDGSKLLALIYEAVFRRRPPRRLTSIVTPIALMLLLSWVAVNVILMFRELIF